MTETTQKTLAGKQFKSLLEAVRKQDEAMNELIKAVREVESFAKTETSIPYLKAFSSLKDVLGKLSRFQQRTGSTKSEELSEVSSRVMHLVFTNKAASTPISKSRSEKSGISPPVTSSSLKPVNGSNTSVTKLTSTPVQVKEKKPKMNSLQEQLFNMAGFDQLVRMLDGCAQEQVRTEETLTKMMRILRRLKGIPVNTRLLQKTNAGLIVAKLKKDENKKVAALSKFLVKMWKATVKLESSQAKKKKTTSTLSQRGNLNTLKQTSKKRMDLPTAKVAKPTKELSYMQKLLLKEKEQHSTKRKETSRMNKATPPKKRARESPKAIQGTSKARKLEKKETGRRYVDASSARSKAELLRAGYGYGTSDEDSDADEDEFDENDPWYQDYQRRCRDSFERIQAEERYSARIGKKEDEEAFIDDD